MAAKMATFLPLFSSFFHGDKCVVSAFLLDFLAAFLARKKPGIARLFFWLFTAA
jgi:hypothetical protein